EGGRRIHLAAPDLHHRLHRPVVTPLGRVDPDRICARDFERGEVERGDPKRVGEGRRPPRLGPWQRLQLEVDAALRSWPGISRRGRPGAAGYPKRRSDLYRGVTDPL